MNPNINSNYKSENLYNPNLSDNYLFKKNPVSTKNIIFVLFSLLSGVNAATTRIDFDGVNLSIENCNLYQKQSKPARRYNTPVKISDTAQQILEISHEAPSFPFNAFQQGLSFIQDSLIDFQIKTGKIYDYQIKHLNVKKLTPEQISDLGSKVLFFSLQQIRDLTKEQIPYLSLKNLDAAQWEKWFNGLNEKIAFLSSDEINDYLEKTVEKEFKFACEGSPLLLLTQGQLGKLDGRHRIILLQILEKNGLIKQLPPEMLSPFCSDLGKYEGDGRDDLRNLGYYIDLYFPEELIQLLNLNEIMLTSSRIKFLLGRERLIQNLPSRQLDILFEGFNSKLHYHNRYYPPETNILKLLNLFPMKSFNNDQWMKLFSTLRNYYMIELAYDGFKLVDDNFRIQLPEMELKKILKISDHEFISSVANYLNNCKLNEKDEKCYVSFNLRALSFEDLDENQFAAFIFNNERKELRIGLLANIDFKKINENKLNSIIPKNESEAREFIKIFSPEQLLDIFNLHEDNFFDNVGYYDLNKNLTFKHVVDLILSEEELKSVFSFLKEGHRKYVLKQDKFKNLS